MRINQTVYDLANCLRFYSRIPVPVLAGESEPHAPPSMTRMAHVVPLAGAVIGAIGAAGLAGAHTLGFGRFVAAVFAIAAIVIVTGAFHEDGLADSADSFGGFTRERRLDIMVDSRIGTFGAVALVLGIMLRVGLLAELLGLGVLTACAALVGAGACSRTAALWLSVVLPPARESGAAFAAGPGDRRSFTAGLIVAAAVTLPLLWPTVGLWPALAGFIAIAAAAAFGARLAERHVGGQTGDLAGATQQVSEIAFFAALLIFAGASRG